MKVDIALNAACSAASSGSLYSHQISQYPPCWNFSCIMGWDFFNRFYMKDLMWCTRKPNFPQMGRRGAYLLGSCKERLLSYALPCGREIECSRCVETHRKPLKLRGKNATSQPNGFTKAASIMSAHRGTIN